MSDISEFRLHLGFFITGKDYFRSSVESLNGPWTMLGNKVEALKAVSREKLRFFVDVEKEI